MLSEKEDFIIIADRMSDIIRSGAEMVPTVLLENLAAMADFVLEATVVGVPDEVWGKSDGYRKTCSWFR